MRILALDSSGLVATVAILEDEQTIAEYTVNYKKISMFIIFPTCNFKCDKECGKQVCQNSTLALSPNIDISIKIDNKQQAIQKGLELQQISIFEWATKNCIYLKKQN